MRRSSLEVMREAKLLGSSSTSTQDLSPLQKMKAFTVPVAVFPTHRQLTSDRRAMDEDFSAPIGRGQSRALPSMAR
jgi:hypothetical protein